ncbi:MAG: hypothetical protein E7581_04750 [Ruminococcaceae bacterium]|nr:hypothetical protein [Oscillospiraceae bacterium]
MTYYNKSAATNANVSVRESESVSLLSLLLSLPAALWQFLCSLGVKRVFKGASLTFCIFAFFGIVGGIETGLITFGLGAVLTVALVVIEIFCLRK